MSPAPPVVRRTARQGLGALAMVLVVLLILVPLVAGLIFHGRGLTVLLGHEERDEEAAWLAGIALQEAVHRVRIGAQTPGSPMYAFLRAPRPGASIRLPVSELPETVAELKDSQSYDLEGPVQVEILRQGYLTVRAELATDYDIHGVLRLTAAVDGRIGTRCVRSRDYGFRLNLVTPPRPFDRPTFLVGDATPLLTRGAPFDDANRMIDFGVERIPAWKVRLAEELVALGQIPRRYRRRLRKFIKPMIEELKRGRAAIEAAGPEWKVVELGSADDEKPGFLHRFPSDLLIYTDGPQYDLGRADLPTRSDQPAAHLDEAGKAVDETTDRRATLIKELMQLFTAKGGSSKREALKAKMEALQQATHDYVEAALAQVGAIHEVFDVYHDFQAGLEELGGASSADVRRQLGRLGADELGQRANFIFRGPDSLARFQAFLDDHPQGIAYVEATTGAIELTVANLQGRLVVVSGSELVIKGASVRDRARDVLTLVAEQGATLEGPADAAVVVAGGEADSQVEERTGSLILAGLPADASIVLHGVLHRQPSIQSAPPNPGGTRAPPQPETLRVELDPYPADWSVGR